MTDTEANTLPEHCSIFAVTSLCHGESVLTAYCVQLSNLILFWTVKQANFYISGRAAQGINTGLCVLQGYWTLFLGNYNHNTIVMQGHAWFSIINFCRLDVLHPGTLYQLQCLLVCCFLKED